MTATRTIDAIIVKSPKTGKVVYQGSKKAKTGEYFLDPSSPQSKFIEQIRILGFRQLPSGFKKNGTGFASKGYLILKQLSEKFEEFHLTVHATEPSSIRSASGGVRVTINHNELKSALATLRVLASEAFETQKNSVAAFLGQVFPKHFEPKLDQGKSYRKNSISNLLNKEGVIDNLSTKDVDMLLDFFPKFVESYSGRFRSASALLALSKSKRVAEVIYLEKLIKDYEARLKAKSQNENIWQQFLSKYILIFNSNYANTLEKESIALQGKYPDFLLIDAYNYLDIYEIKKPTTNLLKKDKSRSNYYWDVEITKAVSQVENYIHYAEKNGPELREEIRKRKGIDVRVMKPRGIIIAGRRSQLKDEIMEDNFRLLNNALKNVEIILYDELLDNLKHFLNKLKK